MTPTRREVRIWAPDADGHRLWYVRLLVQYCRRKLPDTAVRILTTTSVCRSAEWATHLRDGTDIDVLVDDRLNRRTALREAAAEAAMDEAELVVPEGDQTLPDLIRAGLTTRLRGRRLTGAVLLMRMHRQPGPGGAVRFVIKSFAAGLLRLCAPGLRVGTVEAAGRQSMPARLMRLQLVPDPVTLCPWEVSRKEWLDRFAIPPRTKTYLLIGDLSERKHAPEIVSAWFDQPHDDAHLVLVGRPSQEVRRLMTPLVAAGSVHLVEGYVSDRDFDTWVALADHVFVMHRNEGSSGVLLKCAAAGTPVLIGGAGTVMRAARRLGLAVRPVDPTAEGVRAAVRAGSSLPGERRRPRRLPDADDFASAVLHTTVSGGAEAGRQ